MRRRYFDESDIESGDGINLTPLIDVVFIILIAFIIVVPILEIDQIHLASGKGKDSALSKQTAISLQVKKDNSIWIDSKEISLDQLSRALTQLKADKPKAKLQLMHDKKAFFGTYQSVKNAAEEAGFAEMDVMLKPDR